MRLIVSLLALLVTAFAQAPVEGVNVSSSEALSGYDPASYFQGLPQRVNADITLEQAGVVYRFASEENRVAFPRALRDRSPHTAAVVLITCLMVTWVEIDAGTYKLIDGNLNLFYDGFRGDMLKCSNKKLATPPEQAPVAQADEA